MPGTSEREGSNYSPLAAMVGATMFEKEGPWSLDRPAIVEMDTCPGANISRTTAGCFFLDCLNGGVLLSGGSLSSETGVSISIGGMDMEMRMECA